MQGVAGAAQGEFERVTRNALDERSDGPGKAVWDGTSERDGFDLDVKTAVALLKAPVAVHTPEKAVGFARAEGSLMRRGRRVDF